MCVAENTAGSAKKYFNLNVHGKSSVPKASARVCLKRQENCVLHYGGFSCIFNLKQCVGPAFVQLPPSFLTAASRIYKVQSTELLGACFYIILVLSGEGSSSYIFES